MGQRKRADLLLDGFSHPLQYPHDPPTLDDLRDQSKPPRPFFCLCARLRARSRGKEELQEPLSDK